ncbi:hypothetical protein [Xanthomonas sp. BRIP62415]|jgi:hypothetical protein|nr:hypothetical protein [Xanthomonas sp. BRIP62415]
MRLRSSLPALSLLAAANPASAADNAMSDNFDLVDKAAVRLSSTS